MQPTRAGENAPVASIRNLLVVVLVIALDCYLIQYCLADETYFPYAGWPLLFRAGFAGSLPMASAVVIGAILSALIAPPSLVLASGVAFLLSEFADLAVYTPLARRGLVAAVVASSAVGLIVDSIIFLWLAFGSLEFLLGQVVGKSWMVLLSIPLVYALRRRDERLGLTPA